MGAPSQRVIGIAERPWAAEKLYRRFLGTYVLHPQTGTYFFVDTNEKKWHLLVNAFLKLPEQYQRLACKYALTFSFCRFATANGNSSTFYADFNQQSRQKISPHVEMSECSLAPELVLPHLTHEVSHLWWRNLPEESRQRWRQYLQDTLTSSTIEVTSYAQNFLLECLDEGELSDVSAFARRRNNISLWAEESFCESVAVLRCPDYPNRLKNTTVDLKLRKRKVEELTELQLPG